MRKPYFIGFTKRFNGIGIMLEMDSSYAVKPIAWTFEIRLGWLLFWYVKEKKKKWKTVSYEKVDGTQYFKMIIK